MTRPPPLALALVFGLAACACGEDGLWPATARGGSERASAWKSGPLATPGGFNAARSVARDQRTETAKLDPDETLAAAVRSRLADAGFVVLGLVVEASDGVVTLDGIVDSPALHAKAARVASSVEGVKSVVNNLIVLPGS